LNSEDEALGRKTVQGTQSPPKNTEKTLQERAEELQVFVEVLLGCADDPREAEARRPEAALRAQVERLRARLDGPERQAELAAARQQQVRAGATLRGSAHSQ
jgi:hypothetical protein